MGSCPTVFEPGDDGCANANEEPPSVEKEAATVESAAPTRSDRTSIEIISFRNFRENVETVFSERFLLCRKWAAHKPLFWLYTIHYLAPIDFLIVISLTPLPGFAVAF